MWRFSTKWFSAKFTHSAWQLHPGREKYGEKSAGQTPAVLMNFTHVYEQVSFYKKEPHCWIDLTDLEGVNGYCDENAGKAIRERIARLSPYGLHFIDSGNYHYVSKFWTDRIREDFVLVLFDHHTDMQPSRFGELLSCGSWAVKDADEILCPESGQIGGISIIWTILMKHTATGHFVLLRIRLVWRKLAWHFTQAHVRLPVFISIDKDVLSPKEEITDWDQGNMSLAMLEGILQILIRRHRILGIDICGECPELLGEGLEAVRGESTPLNEKLVNFLKDQIFMKNNRAVICRIEDPDFWLRNGWRAGRRPAGYS